MRPNYRLMGLAAIGFLAGMGGFYLAKSGFTFTGLLITFGAIAVMFYAVIKGQLEFFGGLRRHWKPDD